MSANRFGSHLGPNRFALVNDGGPHIFRRPYGPFIKDVLVTKDWNPLEPNILEHKYYAPGVGLIGETKVTGPPEKIELIDIRTE